jgi:hypothetical protein
MAVVSLGPDVGARRSVAREVSAVKAGGAAAAAAPDVEVEDVLVGEHVHRRMLFGNGGGLVQSEARLNVPVNFLTMTAAQRKARAKKKKQQAAKKAAAAGSPATAADADAGDAEDNDADDVAAAASPSSSSAAASAAAASSFSAAAPSPSASLIRYDYLPCEYQHGLLALLALWRGNVDPASAASSPSPSSSSCTSSLRRGVLVGLGGGSLAMFLHRAFPSLLSLEVVELDETVVRTAWQYLGFQERPPQLKAHVADGVTFVHELAERRRAAMAGGDGGQQQQQQDALDVLIIDVNNSDLSAGLSFPPEVFLSESFLQDARTCVAASATGSGSSSGVVLFNFGCRNAALRSELLARVARVFRSVATLRPDEAHVNIVVAATDDEWDEEREKNGSSSELHSSVAGSKRPPSLSWSATMDRLTSLQRQCGTGKKDASSSDFSWSDEMELQSMLARASFVALRQGGEGVDAVDLVPLFPKQKAAQEAKEADNNN